MGKKFIFIAGPVAAGKTIFMERKLYNTAENQCNFFDHDQKKLMIQLYAKNKDKVNDLYLSNALENAINDCLKNDKDFMMQIHFTNEQLSQINTYLHQYKNKFEFHAHFIAVSNFSILKERANKRELLGGHSSEGKLIEKSFHQSFKNFTTYLFEIGRVTIWDNTEDFGFNSMEEQLIFKNGELIFKNTNLTSYSSKMLDHINQYLKQNFD